MAVAQVTPVSFVGQQARHDLRGIAEILDGLEQRRDVERYFLVLRPKMPPAREQQHTEHILRPGRPADDIRPDGTRAVLAPAVCHCLEHGERPARFR